MRDFQYIFSTLFGNILYICNANFNTHILCQLHSHYSKRKRKVSFLCTSESNHQNPRLTFVSRLICWFLQISGCLIGMVSPLPISSNLRRVQNSTRKSSSPSSPTWTAVSRTTSAITSSPCCTPRSPTCPQAPWSPL